MENILDELVSLLKKDERLVSEGELLKNKIIELALNSDKGLLKLLLSDKKMKEAFFDNIEGVLIFDKDKFIHFISNKQFLPDSYTAFRNKIGLTVDNDFLNKSKDVVLSWPYKDCVLEGGMTKEDQKRDEIFWNNVLAPDEINRILDPKVFTNAKRIDKNGSHKLDKFRTDENGNIRDNLIIKGNNLLSLYSLKTRFASKIKLIYIDPPYNQEGSTFYNDSFKHSSWLVFMKNRLEVAKDLLCDEGSIWINIDDTEAHYLKVLCDGIFGRENFVANVVWQKKYSPQNDAKYFSDSHDHILVFAKKKENWKPNLLPRTKEMDARYKNPDNDPRGDWKTSDLSAKRITPKDIYEIVTPSGRKVTPPRGRSWAVSREKFQELLDDNRIWFGEDGNSIPQLKRFLSGVQEGIVPMTIWLYKEVGHNQEARQNLKRIFGGQAIFDTPKPERLLKRIIEIGTDNDDIVLDFFAGSGTAGAVALQMERQFIIVEQMEYTNSVTVERIKKVISGEDGGISKSVNWKGGGEFVYMELMKWNEKFVDRIQKSKTKDDLWKLWKTMKDKSFLSHKVDIKAVNKKANEFFGLSLDDQKRFLLKCLDKNHLYVNYSEINDKDYDVSKEEKNINKQFYE